MPTSFSRRQDLTSGKRCHFVLRCGLTEQSNRKLRESARSVDPRPLHKIQWMERKLAAVLFVDLVASTELVSGADPEIVRRRVTTFFDAVSQCIEAHGGTVEKFAGDAVMAAFGIPRAHEDDAERAVRA